MPGTLDYLTDKLMRGVDADGNVVDMTVVMEVVRDLEQTPITAEDLRMTHLGRIVNETRRKITDKSLARRMKKLVKQWLKLASGQNGTVEDKMSVKSTPSPVADVTVPTATPIPRPLPRPPDSSKPNQYPLPRPQTSIEVNRNPPRLSSSSLPVNGQANGRSDNLVVKIARNQLIKRQQDQDRNRLKKDSTPAPPTLQQTTPISSLIVQIPCKYLMLPGSDGSVSSPSVSVPEHSPSKLIVTIPLSERVNLHKSSSPWHPASSKPSHPTTDINTTTVLNNSTHYSQPVNPTVMSNYMKSEQTPSTPLASITPATIVPSGTPFTAVSLPSGRLKATSEAPNGLVIGVDGIMDPNGDWYSWTDHVSPSSEGSVSVLPYVYIDGLTGLDEKQTWSSLDRSELTDVLQRST